MCAPPSEAINLATLDAGWWQKEHVDSGIAIFHNVERPESFTTKPSYEQVVNAYEHFLNLTFQSRPIKPQKIGKQNYLSPLNATLKTQNSKGHRLKRFVSPFFLKTSSSGEATGPSLIVRDGYSH